MTRKLSENTLASYK